MPDNPKPVINTDKDDQAFLVFWGCLFSIMVAGVCSANCMLAYIIFWMTTS